MNRFYLAIIILTFTLPAYARDYAGEVIKVSDGDTLTIRAGNNRHMTIRLADIDAPEKQQAYGIEAKASLMKLVDGQRVIIHKLNRDRYKRTVGTVYRVHDGLNANREQVRLGSAWAYDEYLIDFDMPDIEDAARNASIGLWGLPYDQKLPPWQWRRYRKVNK